MMKYLDQFSYLWAWSIFSLFILVATVAEPVTAKIEPDATLPNPSRVNRNRSQTIITGGTQTGTNLFHSFRSFSVPARGSASFQQIDPSVRNIFSRITGSSLSKIDGMIEALESDGRVSSANFFLINPNGIVFGEQASLNIGGSFLATTANRIDFADGSWFSATRPQTNSLLTVSAPVGLQFGLRPAPIKNRSYFTFTAPLLDSAGNPLPPPFNDLEANEYEGLRVSPGRMIALIGGDIFSPDGELTSPEGQIELGSIASSGTVELISRGQGWRLNYSDVRQFGNIKLSNSELDVNGERAGSVRLQGAQVLIEGSGIYSYTRNQDGSNIFIHTSRLILDDASIEASTYGSGKGGNIRLQTNQLVLQNGGQISANTYASGRGGNLSIVASDLVTLADIARDQGLPIINSDRNITQSNRLTREEAPFASGLFARVCQPGNECSGSSGRGGNISISTDRLRILAGAQVATESYGLGNAGSIRIQASNIELEGVSLAATGEALISSEERPFPSTLSSFSDRGSSGRAGEIWIEAERLSLRNGATIQTDTLSRGDAGNLRIQATESIELIGTTLGSDFPTALYTFSGGIPETKFQFNRSATGRAGNLYIQTGILIVREGAVIAIGSANPNLNQTVRAGDLQIRADTVRLDNESALLANTNSGQGGSMNFQIADVLILQRGSKISTTAGTAQQGGNGGDINLDSDFVISSPAGNNDITANAFTGNGGNINITTQGILGITPQNQLTPQSDITASSERGIAGEIRISTPNTDPSRGLTELPVNIVDVSNQINRVCPTGSTAPKEPSEFVITGRGGLPANPESALNGENLLADWVTLNDQEPPVAASEPVSEPLPEAPLVEAQGWRRGPAGEVIFTAQASTTAQTGSLPSTHCR